MPTYISLLRGINLGSRNQIKMPDLQALYTDLGFSEVQTYIQSGNVVFQSGKSATASLERQLAAAIEQRFGFPVPVIVRTLDELKAVRDNNPFLRAEPGIGEKELHVTFLGDAPAPDRIEKLEAVPAGEDRFRLDGRDVYLHCPNGYGRTKLSNTVIENKLKVPATTRNWRTVCTLVEMGA